MNHAVHHLSGTEEALTWLQAQGVQHLQCDSRQVQPGDAFVAWPGLATDGRAYVPAALRAGAVACMVEAQGLDASPMAATPVDARVAAFQGLKPVTGHLASAFYSHPSRSLEVVAITGTNGKTSTAWWLAQAMAALGKPCGLMGTLGVGLPGPSSNPLGGVVPTGLTTPDPVAVQKALRAWVDAGVHACAVEASSIGIVEHRLAGTEVTVAVFTNFTQDHLDYHGSMADYWAAKRALFAWPGLKAAVVNVDDAHGHGLAQDLKAQGVLDVWTVSMTDAGARLFAPVCQVTAGGMYLVVAEGDQTIALDLPLVGSYNAANLLGVLASLRALGVPLVAAGQACRQITPVPGRMEVVDGGQNTAPAMQPLVLVDYAHTPDALDKALAALGPITHARGGRLHCVLGCGGDRDASKRPLMAAAAEAHAQQLCLTSDNPRSEDPAHILAHMLAGLKAPAQAWVEPDRALAIRRVVTRAAPADVVLIAGKGHETTQEVKGIRHPFSDTDHARRALRARLAATGSDHMMGLDALLTRLPGARAVGTVPDALHRVHTDTRTLQPGDLFVALKGDTFDAHGFLPQAAAAGAAAGIAQSGLSASGLPGVEVPDTRAALGQLAALWRAQFTLPLVAVTGSNGKTTVTQMLASVLHAAVGADALATLGNLNNDIGVPQTLLRLRAHHRLAVVELGMNHPGEIAGLAAMAAPTVALVNNAQREHQEFMGTVEAVARENGEAITALGSEGVAVFPSDDTYTPLWRTLAGQRRVVTFSDTDANADVHATAHWQGLGWRVDMVTPVGHATLTLGIAGRHNVRNALAACACALAAGVALDAVVQGLQAFEPVKGRSRALSLLTPGGPLTLVDDTYNANPDSVRAAIDVLAALPGPRTLVLGDMGEVGEQGQAFHEEVLAHALASGIDKVFCTGAHMQTAVPAFEASALAGVLVYGLGLDDWMPAVLAQLAQGGSAVVKGSRFMKMERVVQALQAAWAPPHKTEEKAPC